MKTILTTKNDINFTSVIIELLGFTNKRKTAGIHFSEKIANITNVDKVHSQVNCVDGSSLDGKRESIL